MRFGSTEDKKEELIQKVEFPKFLNQSIETPPL